MTAWRLVVAACIAACGQARIPAARFANAPPVRVVDDRRHVPVPPERVRYLRLFEHYDGHFHRRLSRALSLATPRRALGVNAIDEVPDSTWFTNRIGIRALTPAEVRRGPIQIESPEHHKPWTVTSGKVGGQGVGFVISDARGERFLVKLEVPGHPELETAAHVITNRLLWAAGFNVPEDHVVYLRGEDLRIGRGATTTVPIAGERALTWADVERALALADRHQDGTIRALASRIVPGKVLGGHRGEGVRPDDPNDRIPHERRRDLRGAMALYAWLDHGDLNRENFLDVWTRDPEDPARRYVVHYLIDFGRSLGAMAAIKRELRTGFLYIVDFADMASRIVSFGLAPDPWHDRAVPALRGVGLYDARSYDPARWRPDTATYRPWQTSDRFDKFWGAKLIARFTRPQLRAAVEAARLSDPTAADYLVETLLARARKTAHYWFTRVNPLDRFAVARAVQATLLCFDDLMIVHRLAPVAESTRYAVTLFDRAGRHITTTSGARAGRLGRTCLPLVLAPSGDGYTIARITTRRAGGRHGPTYVHLARNPLSGAPRVIGVWRE
jgi:hypothetical protein